MGDESRYNPINKSAGKKHLKHLRVDQLAKNKFSRLKETFVSMQLRRLSKDIHEHQIPGVDFTSDGYISEDEHRRRIAKILSMAIARDATQHTAIETLLHQYEINIHDKETQNILEYKLEQYTQGIQL
jgi:hypothetical protein